uniref:Uncharacterized protein n=1 Tax=Macrostomum lignano TaxID=282301 RepID=A0A1I8FJR1_9PLAT
GNKNLLYTIKRATSGRKCTPPSRTEATNEIPSDRSLPKLYRSDQLDTLANAVEANPASSTSWPKCALASRVVAQVVFDVSINTKNLVHSGSHGLVLSLQVEEDWLQLLLVRRSPGPQANFFHQQSRTEAAAATSRVLGLFLTAKDVWQVVQQRLAQFRPRAGVHAVCRRSFAKSNAYYADRFIVYMANHVPRPPPLPIPTLSDLSVNPKHYASISEGNKVLLYTIKSHIGQDGLQHLQIARAYDRIPKTPVAAPDLYRSNQLDTLPSLIHRTGYKRMVAEMRTDGKVVAQVVFDVSRNPKSLNMVNWFSKSRLVSSYPYQLGKSGYNYFSVAGHQAHKRTFFINSVYAGLRWRPRASGWCRTGGTHASGGTRAGTGSAPALIYTRLPGKKYSQGNAFYADRFLVYLAGGTGPCCTPSRAALATRCSKHSEPRAPATSRPTAPCRTCTAPTSWTRWPGPSPHGGYKRIVAEMRSDRSPGSPRSSSTFPGTPNRPATTTSLLPATAPTSGPSSSTRCTPAVLATSASGWWSDRRDPCKWANKALERLRPGACVHQKKPGKYHAEATRSLLTGFLVYLE